MHEKEKIFGLDLVRCLAICSVLFAHTFYLLPVSLESKAIVLRCFGFIGVEIFFVLSGYLVGKILINLFTNNPVTLRTTFYFWIRRWLRTLPNYYVALIVSAGLFYFSHKIFVFSEPYNLLYFIFSQNLFTPHPDFFHIAWSLSIEEWFYLVMPVWFIMWYRVLKRNKAFIITGIISFMLIILCCRIVSSLINPPEWEAGIRQVVVFRLDAIMTGVFAAYIHLNRPQSWMKHKKISVIGGLLVLMLTSISFYKNVGGMERGNEFFLNTFFFNVVSISVALTLPYLSQWKLGSPNFLQKAVIHTSRISYSLYLIHLIVMFVVLAVLNKVSLELYLVKFIVTWIGCFIAASILYAKFELPIMNKRDRYKLK
jgi:peptidoglycan/LPS O-acetylase OafA/YrhL